MVFIACVVKNNKAVAVCFFTYIGLNLDNIAVSACAGHRHKLNILEALAFKCFLCQFVTLTYNFGNNQSLRIGYNGKFNAVIILFNLLIL